MFNLAAQHHIIEQRVAQRSAPMTGYVPPMPPDPRLQGRAQDQVNKLYRAPMRTSEQRGFPYIWPPTAFEEIYQAQQRAVHGFTGVGNLVGQDAGGNHGNQSMVTNNPHVRLPFFNPAVPPPPFRHAPRNTIHGNAEDLSLFNFDNFPEDFGVNQISPRESDESRPSSVEDSPSEGSLRISESPAVVPEHVEVMPNADGGAAVGAIPVEPLSPSDEPAEVPPQPTLRSEHLDSTESIRPQPLTARVSSHSVDSLKKRLERRYHEEKRYQEQQAMNEEIIEEDQENLQEQLQENQEPIREFENDDHSKRIQKAPDEEETPVVVEALANSRPPVAEPEDDEVVFLFELFNPNNELNAAKVPKEESTDNNIEPELSFSRVHMDGHMVFSPFGARQETEENRATAEEPAQDLASIGQNVHEAIFQPIVFRDEEFLQALGQAQPIEDPVAPSPNGNQETEEPMDVLEKDNQEATQVQEGDGTIITQPSKVTIQETDNPLAEPTSESSTDEPMNENLLQDASKPQDRTDEVQATTNGVQNPAASTTEEPFLVPMTDNDDSDEDELIISVDQSEWRMVDSSIPIQERGQQEKPQELERPPSAVPSSSMSLSRRETEPCLKEKSQTQKSCSEDPLQPPVSLPKKTWKIEPPPLPKKSLPQNLPQFDKLEERGIRATKWAKYCLVCLAHGLINKHGRVSVCRLKDCKKPHRCQWKQQDFEKLHADWKSTRTSARSWSASLKERDEDLWDSEDDEPPISTVKIELVKVQRSVRRLQKQLKKKSKMASKKRRARFFKKIHFNLRKEKTMEVLRRAASGDLVDTVEQQTNHQGGEQDGVVNKRKHSLAEVQDGAPEVKRRRLGQDGRQTPVEDRTSSGSTKTADEATAMDRYFEEFPNAVNDSAEEHAGISQDSVMDELNSQEVRRAPVEATGSVGQAQVPNLTEMDKVERSQTTTVKQKRNDENLQKHKRSLNEVVADLTNGASSKMPVSTSVKENGTMNSSPCTSSSADGIVPTNRTTQPIKTLSDVLSGLQNPQPAVQLKSTDGKSKTSCFNMDSLLNFDQVEEMNQNDTAVNSLPSESELAQAETNSMPSDESPTQADNTTAGAAASSKMPEAAAANRSPSNTASTSGNVPSTSSTALYSPAVVALARAQARVRALENQIATASSSAATPSRANYCLKCLNHGKPVLLKGHKYECEYADCACTEHGCDKLEEAKRKRKAKYLAKNCRPQAPPGGSI